MEINNPKILELISKSRDSIKTIKDTTKDDISEIKKLANEIKEIAKEVEVNLKIEQEKLNFYENELLKIGELEINKNIENIGKLIISNLPKKIKSTLSQDSQNIKLYPVEIKDKDIEKDSKLGLIGHIIIESIGDIFSVKVIILINNKEDTFKIKKSEPLRIYKIISYINDNLNYDE